MKDAPKQRGDATMGRIADLAGGWNVNEGEERAAPAGPSSKSPAEAAPPAARPRASAPPPPRSAPRTAPPPPPRAGGATTRLGLPTTSPPPPGKPAEPALRPPATAASALPPPAARPTKPIVDVDSLRPTRAPVAVSDDEEEDEDSILVPMKSAAAAVAPVAAPIAAPAGSTRAPSLGSIDIDLDDAEEKTVASGPPPRKDPSEARSRKEDSGLLFVTKPASSQAAAPLPADGSLFDLSTARRPAAVESAAPAKPATADSPRAALGEPTSEITSPLESSALLTDDSGIVIPPPPAPSPPAAVPLSMQAAVPAASKPAPAPAAAPVAPAAAGKPLLIADEDSGIIVPPPSAKGAAADPTSVPVGEFEPAALGAGGRRQPDVESETRGDPTSIDSAHLRSDQTELREARNASVSDAGIAATLRHTPSLPRRRGAWGDFRYVFTVWLGTRRAKRELRKLEAEQQEREKTRRRHLITIGRAAATSAELDQTQIRKTRGTLQAVDADRSNQAAQVAASESEAEQVRRERAAKATAHREEIEALELEQEQLTQKLEPMQKEAAAARRRATDLRASLARLDARVSDVEAGRGKWADSASQAAELAALRAERQGISRDEPLIAAQLDALVPRIAAIEASRERLRRKVIERNEEEEEDSKRTEELLSAIAAKRKVVERATADAEKQRERMLAELGERLYVDRPKNLSAHLSPIDSIDLELGDGQRRMMELKEILASIDRWKLVRGLLLLTLLLVAIGGGVWFWLQGQIPFLPPPP